MNEHYSFLYYQFYPIEFFRSYPNVICNKEFQKDVNDTAAIEAIDTIILIAAVLYHVLCIHTE